jgi:hypothetical protein
MFSITKAKVELAHIVLLGLPQNRLERFGL